MKACDRPSGTDVLLGVTAIDASAAAVTVSGALAVTPEAGCKAVIVVVPVANVVAIPRRLAALLTEAMAPAEDNQVTAAVRSCVVPSVKVPVAVKA